MNKLSICIPTYNRSNLLISQLDFLKNEIIPYKDLIDVIVADNFSDYDHREKLIDYHSKNNFFDLKLNQTNLGSIGNIYYLLEQVNGDFVWFVSDDDILLEGVIDRVMNIILNNYDISYIYLRYNAFKTTQDNIVSTVNLLNYNGYISEGKQCLIDLAIENGSISMFITSCVYSVVPLKAFCASRPKQLLIDPLLFSFKLALGAIYIEKEVFVLQRLTVPSWSSAGVAIFSWQVQLGLIELLEHSYKKVDIKNIIYSMYESNQGNYLRMLLQAPFQDKKSIVSFLGYRHASLMLFSFFYNIKRVINKYIVINYCTYISKMK